MPARGEIDLSWEALIEETSASIPAERGKCNAALRLIRQAMGDEADEIVAQEIRKRASRYRLIWPGISLTPTALAKHWTRIDDVIPSPGTNLTAYSDCEVCSGDRLVVAEQHVDGSEVYKPCPECGPSLAVL